MIRYSSTKQKYFSGFPNLGTGKPVTLDVVGFCSHYFEVLLVDV